MNKYFENVTPMSLDAAKQICSWQYEPPYSVYNYMTYEEALKKHAPIIKAKNADNYFCFWKNEKLVAYTSIIIKGKKVNIGISIAPQFCGQGFGNGFLNKTILEAQKRYSDKEIWVQVRSWNERAIRCYRKSGFVEKYREIISDRFNQKTEFVFMRLEESFNFSYIEKHYFSTVANEIFNILANNMKIIAPTGNSREEDFKCWYEGVSNCLKRDERQIVLIKDADEIIGFFQYYLNEDTFMMEEIQFRSEYQGIGVLRALYSFVIPRLKNNIEFVEAYANINNSKSIGILEKFGLIKLGLSKNGRNYHFKGRYSDLLKWYYGKE